MNTVKWTVYAEVVQQIVQGNNALSKYAIWKGRVFEYESRFHPVDGNEDEQ